MRRDGSQILLWKCRRTTKVSDLLLNPILTCTYHICPHCRVQVFKIWVIIIFIMHLVPWMLFPESFSLYLSLPQAVVFRLVPSFARFNINSIKYSLYCWKEQYKTWNSRNSIFYYLILILKSPIWSLDLYPFCLGPLSKKQNCDLNPGLLTLGPSAIFKSLALF